MNHLCASNSKVIFLWIFLVVVLNFYFFPVTVFRFPHIFGCGSSRQDFTHSPVVLHGVVHNIFLSFLFSRVHRGLSSFDLSLCDFALFLALLGFVFPSCVKKKKSFSVLNLSFFLADRSGTQCCLLLLCL